MKITQVPAGLLRQRQRDALLFGHARQLRIRRLLDHLFGHLLRQARKILEDQSCFRGRLRVVEGDAMLEQISAVGARSIGHGLCPPHFDRRLRILCRHHLTQPRLEVKRHCLIRNLLAFSQQLDEPVDILLKLPTLQGDRKPGRYVRLVHMHTAQ
ncbi:hypothetical protein D3C80_675420 [compost metagenome]